MQYNCNTIATKKTQIKFTMRIQVLRRIERNQKIMTLVPAYGRDYKSAKTVRADFDANKDFLVSGMNDQGSFADDGRYANKQDLIGKYIQIRYNRMQKVVAFKVG
jgi:hypothetical protein